MEVSAEGACGDVRAVHHPWDQNRLLVLRLASFKRELTGLARRRRTKAQLGDTGGVDDGHLYPLPQGPNGILVAGSWFMVPRSGAFQRGGEYWPTHCQLGPGRSHPAASWATKEVGSRRPGQMAKRPENRLQIIVFIGSGIL